MFKAIVAPISFSLLTIFGIQLQPANAFNLTLESGSNIATYDDDFDTTGSLGFSDWQVDDDRLLTETGWFYRLGSGQAQPLDTLTEGTFTNNGSSATLNYSGTGFTMDLDLSLADDGSTLGQTATVTNTSGSNLNFNLYFYQDLIASIGNSGDRVSIDSNSYTATQTGDLYEITTTVEQTSTGLSDRNAEVDVIDFNEDTLYDKLLEPSGENLVLNNSSPNNNLSAVSSNENLVVNNYLDNDLEAASSTSDPVTSAYEWNYNLSDGESFQVTTNSAAVPFEFSPGLGILLSGIIAGGCYFKRKLKKPSDK
ncbi:hypothetical protein [Myxosarcina sp. GI1]|uniref:PFE-CTERM domain-containing protein n=1 Tax=Myxosarcina sp. GI1 TaxID=1541065 RepID=UPI000561A15F|nr:hypothetical protein [Myxosarcina sp. GI1]